MNEIGTEDGAGIASHWRRTLSRLGGRTALALFIVCVGGSVVAQSPAAEARHSYVPPNGFVPNGTTAVKIAEAVLTPIYSARTIRAERPLRASLANGIWTVIGTLSCSVANSCPEGVAIVEIDKKDGRILRVSHGK